MAGALVEIWLTISALSSLAILSLAIGHSDMRLKRRLRPKAVRPQKIITERQPLPR
ncbi:hypothetical protein [Sphingomonas sp. GM_Shp_1]|uniref:hypothetical protein n=1 Tax=Sphingomonas sp. GM_Shp_1 TaxID=2937381 RepID=UPI00226BB1C0|nr:hypothetical protein [Sphingomonas sp. GM_Shp_1]